MRLRLIGLILLSYFMLVATSQATVGNLIICFDASNATSLTVPLPDGPVSGMDMGAVTPGTPLVGSTFDPIRVPDYTAYYPVLGTVAGRRAFSFTGQNGFVCSKTAPSGAIWQPIFRSGTVVPTTYNITGSSPWTMSAWVYKFNGNDPNRAYFQFASRGANGCSAMFFLGDTTPFSHYGFFDMGWGRLIGTGASNGNPLSGQWVNVTDTYDGLVEKLFVNGVAVNAEDKTLRLYPNSPIRIGHQNSSSNNEPNVQRNNSFTGAVASIKLWDNAMNMDEIRTNCVPTAPVFNAAPNAPLLMNNSFEAPIISGTSATGLYVPGWEGSPGNPCQTGLMRQWGGSNGWDNGMAVDSQQVAFLTANTNTSASITAVFSGIASGKTAKAWAYVNASSGSSGKAKVGMYIDSVSVLASTTVNSTGAANTNTGNWTYVVSGATAAFASNNAHSLRVYESNAGAANSILLIDKVGVAEVGGPGIASFNSSLIDFIGVQQGSTKTTSVTLWNEGGSNMSVLSATITPNDGVFTIPAAQTFPQTVNAFGKSINLQVSFTPPASGTYNATLVVNTDSANTPSISIPLTGYSSPQVYNASFETPQKTTGNGDDVPVPGWNFMLAQANNLSNLSAGIGQQNMNNEVANKGLADGNQAFYIKGGNGILTQTVTQMIPGLTSGTKYHLVFYACAATKVGRYCPCVVRIGNPSDYPTGVDRAGKAWATSTRLMVKGGYKDSLDPKCGYTLLQYDQGFKRIEADYTPTDNNAKLIEFQAGFYDWQTGALLTKTCLNIDKVKLYDPATTGTLIWGSTASNTNPLACDFATMTLGTSGTKSSSFFVRNMGSKDVSVTSMTFRGPNADVFAPNLTLPVNCPGMDISNVNLGVLCKGLYTGNLVATMTLTTDAGQRLDIPCTVFVPNGPYIPNQSFEQPATSDVTADQNGNTPTYWSSTAGSNSGYVIANGNQYYDNGRGVDGAQVMWIKKDFDPWHVLGGQSDTSATRFISNSVYGLQANRVYKVTAYVNASRRSGYSGQATFGLTMNTNGTLVSPVPATRFSAVDSTYSTAGSGFIHPFLKYSGDFAVYKTVNANTMYLYAGASTNRDGLLIDYTTVSEVLNQGVLTNPAKVTLPQYNRLWNAQTQTATVVPTTTSVRIQNTGTGPLTGVGLSLLDFSSLPAGNMLNNNYFTILSKSSTATTLNPGEFIDAVIQFDPSSSTAVTTTTFGGVLRVTSNDEFKTPYVDIPLTGDLTYLAHQAVSPFPASWKFIAVNAKLTTITASLRAETVTNSGDLPLILVGGTSVTQGYRIWGTNAGEFGINPNGVAPNSKYILSRQSQVVTMFFKPFPRTVEEDDLSANLEITTNDPFNPVVEIPLTGDAVTLLPPIAFPTLSYTGTWPKLGLAKATPPNVNVANQLPRDLVKPWGPTTTTLDVWITNIGDLPLTCTTMLAKDGVTSVPALSITGANANCFTIANISTSTQSSIYTLDPGHHFVVTLTFFPIPVPTSVQTYKADLMFYYNDGSTPPYPLDLPIEGKTEFKYVQKIACNPTTVTFVDVNLLWGPKLTTSSLTVFNKGDLPLVLQGGTTYTLPGLALTTTTNFQILRMKGTGTLTTSTSSYSMPAKAWDTFALQFKPAVTTITQPITFTTTCTITSNDPDFDFPNLPKYVILKGTVRALTPPKVKATTSLVSVDTQDPLTSITFGTVTPNAAATNPSDPTKSKITKVFYFNNIGQSTLTLNSGGTGMPAGISTSGGVGTINFKNVVSTPTLTNILGGNYVKVTMDYDPTTQNPLIIPRNENTDLKFSTNDPAGATVIHLNAFYNNYMPHLVADWSTVMFPWVNVEGTDTPTNNTAPTTKVITLTNVGQLPFTFATLTGNVVKGLSLMGSNYTDFKIVKINGANPADLSTLAAGASVQVTIQFQPFGHFHRFGLLGRLYVSGQTTTPNDPYGNVTVLLNADAVPVAVSRFKAE